ncbi:MAG: acyl-CoA dehydrogenase, partial [Gammaproteobacteria bacterium]
LAAAGYTVSRAYAMERVQGRHPDEKDPAARPVAIIEHADVRRLLLQQRSYIEGSLAVLLFCAKLIDLERVEEDQAKRKELSLFFDLLTPVAKGWPSEFCPIANKNAIQILGGSGYTRDFPAERLYRDNRLNAIHDGTTAMQAIDLLGRKVRMADGAAFEILIAKMSETINDGLAIDGLSEFAQVLREVSDELLETTKLMQQRAGGDARLYLANATLYLEAVGHVVIAWMWLQQGILATQLLGGDGRNNADYYAGKLVTMRYYFHYELPSVAPRLALLKMVDDTCVGTHTNIF